MWGTPYTSVEADLSWLQLRERFAQAFASVRRGQPRLPALLLNQVTSPERIQLILSCKLHPPCRGFLWAQCKLCTGHPAVRKLVFTWCSVSSSSPGRRQWSSIPNMVLDGLSSGPASPLVISGSLHNLMSLHLLMQAVGKLIVLILQ